MIRLEKIEEVKKIIDAIPAAVASAISDVRETIFAMIKKRTPFFTGNLLRSWSTVDNKKGSLSFSTGVLYAPKLEAGDFKKVGPKTVAQGGKIYSKHAPGGILQPIIEDESVTDMIVDRIIKQVMAI